MKTMDPDSSDSSTSRSEIRERPLVGWKKFTNSEDVVGGMYRSVMEISILKGGTAGRGDVLGADATRLPLVKGF